MKRLRDATTIIGVLDHGDVAADLGREILETLADLKEQSGDRPKVKVKGEVTLTLKLLVETGTVIIEADIKSKRPRKARGTSYFWLMDDGALSTEHPKQVDMFAGPRSAATEEMA